VDKFEPLYEPILDFVILDPKYLPLLNQGHEIRMRTWGIYTCLAHCGPQRRSHGFRIYRALLQSRALARHEAMVEDGGWIP